MDLITIETIHRLNPWLKDQYAWKDSIRRHLPEPYVDRHLVNPLKNNINKVNLVVGPRQSGKSTLIWHHLSTVSEPFLLINCEEPSCRELCKSPALFLSAIQKITEPRPLPGLFFEEAQHLENAGLFLKGLVDMKPDVPMFVTGSSSYHLRSKTRESLAGRASRHYLLPFGLKELTPEQQTTTLAHEDMTDSVWKRLLIWGGYPDVVLEEDKQAILAELIESFVLRDASDVHRIKRPDAFRKILMLAASQVGNLVNYADWAEKSGVSVGTVAEYVNLMEENHILKLVPPFVGGKRAEIISTPKVYFLDNGLRNQLFGRFLPPEQRGDYGALTENLTLTELCKNTNPLLDEIRFWRTKSGAEVDFIVRKADQMVVIEVKAGRLNRPKISRSLRSFIQAYHPHIVYVLNESLVDSLRVENTEVVFDKLIRLPSILR